MIIYPAIDLKDGKCVRLTQGDMARVKIYHEDPAKQAVVFQDAGFAYLHLVDLDGAFQGNPANEHAIKSILSHVTIPVQLGGGLRNMDVIGKWLSNGIARVILGTVAQKNPIFVKEACRQFPDQVVVGIDAVKGFVAINGWGDITDQKASDLAKKFEDAGVTAIIYTDIDRDGAMQGPNVEETVALAQSVTIPVIASGGITCKADVDRYRARATDGIDGVIIGKALYEGSINPGEVLGST